MATFVAKTIISDHINEMKGQITGNSNKKNICWDDFNYPPLIKVIHYDINDVDADQRLTVRALWLSHLFVALYSITNIITNIAMAASGGGPGVWVLYSFMFFFSFNPIQCIVFYRGYKGIASDAFLLKLYKIIQIVLIICWVTFSVIHWVGFYGFVALSDMFSSGYVFQGLMAVIGDILLLLTALLSIFALVKIWSVPVD